MFRTHIYHPILKRILGVTDPRIAVSLPICTSKYGSKIATFCLAGRIEERKEAQVRVVHLLANPVNAVNIIFHLSAHHRHRDLIHLQVEETFVRDKGVVLKKLPIFWFHNFDVQTFNFSVESDFSYPPS